MAPTADTVVVDLSNYKDRNGARVPEGTYRVVVEDAEQSKAKTGNVMITVWLRIVGGEFDGETIVDRLTLTEKSLFRVVGFLQAIGIKTPRSRLRVPLEAIKGKTLDVEAVDGEPYMNRIKSEVRSYMRVTPKGTKAVEADPWETPEPEADVAPEDTEEANAIEIEADAEVELDDIELR